MFLKKYSDCEKIHMRGKHDESIDVSIIEMFRPQDGFDLSYNVGHFPIGLPFHCRASFSSW
jgi:hypothetical protein